MICSDCNDFKLDAVMRKEFNYIILCDTCFNKRLEDAKCSSN